MTTAHLQFILPEIILLVSALFILVEDLFISKESQWTTYLLSQVAIVVTAYFAYMSINLPDKLIFSGQYMVDNFSQTLKFMMLIIFFITLLYGRKHIAKHKLMRGEYYVLTMLSTLGMMLLVSAKSLLVLYMALECLTLPLYILVAMRRDSYPSVEAGMKYFVTGALASGLLLYGMSFLYGITGTIQLDEIAKIITNVQGANLSVTLFAMVFILAGVAFKFGAVPFHMWVPDIYQGSPTNVTLFLGTIPKIAAFGMAYRLLHDAFGAIEPEWGQLILLFAILSLAIGNIVAIAQTNIKRLLGYSTIAHVGYLFLALIGAPKAGYTPALYYVVVYALTTGAAFGILLFLNQGQQEVENIEDLSGLASTHPWVAFMLMLVMFSLAGVPPLVGFFAKFAIISALLDVGLAWVAVLAVIFSVIGAFYYIRVVKVMYFDKPVANIDIVSSYDMRIMLSLHSIAILLLGIVPAPLFMLCQSAF